MNEILIYIVPILLLIILALLIILLSRKTAIDINPIIQNLDSIYKSCERTERVLKDEIAINREESANAAHQSRLELGNTLKGMGDTLNQQILNLTHTNDEKLEKVRNTVEERLHNIQEENSKKLDMFRQDSLTMSKHMRDEMSSTIKSFTDTLTQTINEMSKTQSERLAAFGERLDRLTQSTEQKLTEIRQEFSAAAAKIREEFTAVLKSFNESVGNRVNDLSALQKIQLESMQGQLTKLTASNEQRMETLKTTIEGKLDEIRQDNAKQLEQMRITVDEKLQGTLEKRLGESFKQVSERLEQVYKGLGEMQALASGVGDLKKVLTNVKTRGIWGEVQLGALLEQVLTPEQYEKNVAVKGGAERVEFAVKLPGRAEDKDDVVWLPIDAKFPVEDYQRLIEAQEKADADMADIAGKQLESRIKQSASDICNKYINPPKTTDFGILFLPTEGLFAEVIRRTSVTEFAQRECRVVIAGPTTLWSILSSLQMGFKTLAIEKRSSEVWNLLAAVKTEWTKYGEVLGKIQKKLHEASETIEDAQTRTRAIGRKLKDVQTLPASEAKMILKIDNNADKPE